MTLKTCREWMTLGPHTEEELDLPRLHSGGLPDHGPVPGAEQGVGEHLHPILKLNPVNSGRVTLMIGAALEARAGALRT